MLPVIPANALDSARGIDLKNKRLPCLPFNQIPGTITAARHPTFTSATASENEKLETSIFHLSRNSVYSLKPSMFLCSQALLKSSLL